MINKYINIYNNLINLTRNKNLYKDFVKQDTFSDRLIIFLFHFSFFLKVFKIDTKKEILQNIYDCIFRQLELSIRELGYGDMTINKKMKNYLNIFHSIINKIDEWENLSNIEKKEILNNFLNNDLDKSYLIEYFNNFLISLEKNTLNFYIKGVIKPKL